MADQQELHPRRRIVYIPIIHALSDMGELGGSVQRQRIAQFGRQSVARSAAAVERAWDEVERAVRRLRVVPQGTRVYQDGLPVCEHEQEIVSSLAAAGSRNHKLLLELQDRGAILMGTESPDLLVEEYQVAMATFSQAKTPGTRDSQQQMKTTLLERRDRYIAGRIDQTLQQSQMGILFIGALHNTLKYLPPDIEIVHTARTDRREKR